MNTMSLTAAQVAVSKFPNCEAVTVHIAGDDISAEMHMTADDCAAPFARVVEILPSLIERLRAEIRTAGGSLYVPLSVVDYVDEDGGSDILIERSAPGGSPH